MTDDPITPDLARFGARERHMLADILNDWNREGLPDDFEDDEVRAMLNTHSGYVFLTNADYQAAMINPDSGHLETHYSTPYEGREGFWSELVAEFGDMHPEDQEYMRDLAGAWGFEGLPTEDDES